MPSPLLRSPGISSILSVVDRRRALRRCREVDSLREPGSSGPPCSLLALEARARRRQPELTRPTGPSLDLPPSAPAPPSAAVAVATAAAATTASPGFALPAGASPRSSPAPTCASAAAFLPAAATASGPNSCSCSLCCIARSCFIFSRASRRFSSRCAARMRSRSPLDRADSPRTIDSSSPASSPELPSSSTGDADADPPAPPPREARSDRLRFSWPPAPRAKSLAPSSIEMVDGRSCGVE
eukprot:scaffold17457_cov105-Isochrysis_galbana.AAC.17